MREELCRLGIALVMGACAGLMYDMLRPVRRKCRKTVGMGLDILYSMLCGMMIFMYAMSADTGKLGLWELVAALTGFLLYLNSLSPPILTLFTKGLDMLCSVCAGLRAMFSKIAGKLKSLVQKALDIIQKTQEDKGEETKCRQEIQ